MKYLNRYNFKLIAVAIILSIFAVACEDDSVDPTGDFTFSVSSDNTLSVAFAASGADVQSVSWDFGDGETSTSIRPVHTYEAGGSYTVVLILTGESGSSPATVSKMVSVVDSPIADFVVEVNYLTVTFTNATTFAEAYSWDFGDGETSTDENPVHTYAESGDYIVTLSATGIEGTIPGSVEKTVSVAEKAFTAIELENADFELPGTGKIPNWETIPGWSCDEQVTDSGVDGPGTNGNFWGYLWNQEPSVYNLTDHVIAEGEEFKLTLDAWDAYYGGDFFTVTLYYNLGDGTRNVLATETFDTVGDDLELTMTATEASIGARLGIELKANATGNTGWGNNGWTAFDNVQLFVR